MKGNLYTTNGTVKVHAPDGKLVEEIKIPEGPANCTFGGDDMKTLFITAKTSLYSIRTKNAGAKPVGMGAQVFVRLGAEQILGALEALVPGAGRVIEGGFVHRRRRGYRLRFGSSQGLCGW